MDIIKIYILIIVNEILFISLLLLLLKKNHNNKLIKIKSILLGKSNFIIK